MKYLGNEYFSHIDGNQSVHMGKLGLKLHKGGGGGDGGAAARKAAEDERIAKAVKQLNEVFGVIDAQPEAVDRNAFNRQVQVQNTSPYGFVLGMQPTYQNVFDQAGYDAAVKASEDKANALREGAKARETLYGKIGTDATNVAMTDINKERGIAQRELGFSLARNGLSGGSRDIDANRDVLDTYQQGVLKASNIGNQSKNTARTNDEKTRVNLISSIYAGLSSGDATQQAYAGMANNARAAQDEANASSLAGFFDVIRQQQDRNQYQRGVDSAFNSGNTFKTAAANRTNPSYNGTTRVIS